VRTTRKKTGRNHEELEGHGRPRCSVPGAHLREEDDVANRLGVREQHGQAVDAEAATAGGRESVAEGAEVQGEVTDMQGALIGLGAVLAPAMILLWIGFALASVVAGLFLAGVAGRQVRAAGALISPRRAARAAARARAATPRR